MPHVPCRALRRAACLALLAALAAAPGAQAVEANHAHAPCEARPVLSGGADADGLAICLPTTYEPQAPSAI